MEKKSYSGIRSGVKESIPFAPQAEIFVPANVELQGQNIVWQTEYQGAKPRPGTLKKTQVAGCLREFSALSQAGGDRVLNFVHQFGPLGIFPSVETLKAPDFCHEWPRRHWTWPESAWEEPADDKKLNEWGGKWSRRYSEPIAIYQYLASVTKSLLSIVKALEGGETPRREDLMRCVPLDEPEIVLGLLGAQPKGILIHIRTVAIEWQAVAHFKATFLHPTYDVPTVINFGLASEEWDVLPERKGAMEQLVGNLSDYVRTLPHMNQRPSPLFNALTYHLIQEMMFPENGYFCAYCRKFYIFDPAKNLYHQNRNSPRRDKNSWCSQECQDEYGKNYDHQKYLVRKQRQTKPLQ